MLENFAYRITSSNCPSSFRGRFPSTGAKGTDVFRTYIVKKSLPESEMPYAKYWPFLEKADVAIAAVPSSVSTFGYV